MTVTLAGEPGEAKKRSASSAYVQIANELRDRILEQNLAPNTLLPSERELGEQHGVSRMTARHALTLLENEGYIYRRPPRGTFVAEPRVSFRIGSFTTEIERLGREPGADLVWADLVDPPGAAREAFELPDGELVVGLQRVRRADREPIAIETTSSSKASCRASSTMICTAPCGPCCASTTTLRPRARTPPSSPSSSTTRAATGCASGPLRPEFS